MPVITISFVSRLLYFTCMKYRITSVALNTAMPSATVKLNDAQVDVGRKHREARHRHQGAEDGEVDADGRNVTVCLTVIHR